MSDKPPSAENDWTITLQSQDRTPYRCRILDIFPFGERQYAVLLRLDKSAEVPTDGGDEPPLVIMRPIEGDDRSVFETIESEDEFERVSVYLCSRVAS